MNLKSILTDNETEVRKIELDLKARNYHLVEKTNEWRLKPYEYIKNIWSGSPNSFGSSTYYTITWYNTE